MVEKQPCYSFYYDCHVDWNEVYSFQHSVYYCYDHITTKGFGKLYHEIDTEHVLPHFGDQKGI